MAEKENNTNTFLGADSIYEDVENEHGKTLKLEYEQSKNLVGLIKSRFNSCETARKADEARWLTSYQNFRGLYGKRVRFRESEKSRVFIKVTKTKTIAAYGQLVDVLFGSGQFPLSVKETKMPEGIAGKARVTMNTSPMSIEAPQGLGDVEVEQDAEPQSNPFDVGYEGDGNVLLPGATFKEGENFLGSLADNYTDQQGRVVLEAGLSAIPQVAEISPAQKAARNMEKLIHDQLEESNGVSELRNALFEAAMLGTGIIKGPFSFNKTLHRWDKKGEEREYNPIQVRVPRVEFVSCWDFYPDPNATSIEECDFIIHRHKFNRSQLRGLRNLPYFDKDAIRNTLSEGPNYEEKYFENQLNEDNNSEDYSTDRYEILEYWGIMDADYAREVGIDLPDSIDDLDEVQINAWTCGSMLLRAVINPFTPPQIPYHAFPYERNPYSFFGIGVPENMADSQQIMNGHARMAVDNLALAGSLVFDVDDSALVGGQSMEIYPGKIFRRQAGMPGQAIHGLKFPNTAPENMMMFDKFRQLADEQTGIPSYSHGQTGVQSMTRTASGMSMLLGASSLNIKTVVKNIDDFLLKPLGESYFHWNMQFIEEDLDTVGDLEINAMGTSSLMQKEVRSQRLTMFLQTAQNPTIAPFIKVSKLISELAHTLDLDPDEILNDPEEAAIAAQIIGMQNAQQETSAEDPTANQQQTAMGGTPPAPSQPQELGATGTGGGNIGTGNVPQSGEDQFSGTLRAAKG
tara:strand:- start:1164 stop:3389 length:2226 start_codon:yes stop_codon:yes gene_type:complete